MPSHLKTISPVESGGIAGGMLLHVKTGLKILGKKYIKEHMFFKFATDDSCNNIYGSDENAAKAVLCCYMRQLAYIVGRA